MAEVQSVSSQTPPAAAPAPAVGESASRSAQFNRRQLVNETYALPVPIRTFPLPAFYPNNPISLLHLVYAWVTQVIRPPGESIITYNGSWAPELNAVVVKEHRSMRALWEQGFYGKGNLSRSEPNWLKQAQLRRGQEVGHVSEVLTAQRRQERAETKWERARLEQAAIRRTRLEEAAAKEAALRSGQEAGLPTPPQVPSSPVGPLQLLAMPNSESEQLLFPVADLQDRDTLLEETPLVETPLTPVLEPASQNGHAGPATENGAAKRDAPLMGDDVTPLAVQQKAVTGSKGEQSATLAENVSPLSQSVSATEVVQAYNQESEVIAELGGEIVDKEHLQLMPEEALFLSFGLGVLKITDPATEQELSAQELLANFRRHSYFPPKTGTAELAPDDGFLVHYAVYHHFRSMGWVPRAGIKFAVDWLLYARGPVFDHAEFGIIVLPAYTDAWWREQGRRSPTKTWPWLHGVVRVLSHAVKSLVLVYVEVPSPPAFEAALQNGFAEALKLYKVREVMVKRWSSNRNR